MLIVSTGYKRAILGPQSFPDIFNGGRIRIFAAPRPAAAEAPEPASALGDVVRYMFDTGLEFFQANEYIIKQNAHIWRFQATSPGTALWFRLTAPGDDGQASLTQPRMDGDIAVIGQPAELSLVSTTIAAGDSILINSFNFTIPPLLG